MNKQEYLLRTYKRLDYLTGNQDFTQELSQVRAKAIQEELLPEQTITRFTFDPEKIWKYCDFVFSESSLLLREGTGNTEELRRWIREAANTFEFLSKFGKDDEKEILLLNSAMCYHISGYQANARCIARQIEENYLNKGHPNQDIFSDGSPDDILTHLFRLSLVKFLKRDIRTLQQITNQAETTIQNLQERVTQDIRDGNLSVKEIFNLTAHAYFQQAMANFVQYCLYGKREDFLDTQQSSQKCYEHFKEVGDATFGTITSEVRTLLSQFEAHSTWSVIEKHAKELLDDEVWQAYLRLLAFDKSIVEFWLSQLKAISSNLLTTDDSFVVQMPTSAGKTLIAELAILAALTQKKNSRCLYIAPYRALVNEIENNLVDTLGALGYRVSNIIGGFEFDTFQDYLLKEADVLVVTPEKVELLLRAYPEYFQNLAVVIIDEGHILDEGIPAPDELTNDYNLRDELVSRGTLGRGTLLELQIARIKHQLPEVRFIFLSAVMPDVNADDFVEWLSKNKQEPLKIERNDRPSRLVIVKFEWRNEENGELEYVSLPKLSRYKRSPWVPFVIKRDTYYTGELTKVKKQRKKQKWPANITSKSQTTAILAVRFAQNPVLVFCAQTDHVTNVVDNIITTLKFFEASNKLPDEKLKYVENPTLESYELALEWLGAEHTLTKALQYRVGLHYGPLPDPVRQAVEDDFRSGKIRILVSTNTLGQGVNMPVKTAIIYSLERRWVEKDEEEDEVEISPWDNNVQVHVQKITKRDFWNICGRAGRAGKETEGQVIFVVKAEKDPKNPGKLLSQQKDLGLLEEFQNLDNLEEVLAAKLNEQELARINGITGA